MSNRRLPIAAAMAAAIALRAFSQGASDREPWLVAGPFPIGQLGGLEGGLDRDYLSGSGEASATPSRVVASDTKVWREDAGRADGEGVDFNLAFGPCTYSVAYAYREIVASSPRRMALKVGSDDGVKVWVNGELVLANHVVRALRADEDAVAVSLARGKNRILVKVSQAEGEWGFLLRFAGLGEEAASAASVKIGSLSAFPDELAFPAGGIISGVVMSRPAFCLDGAAKVELLGPSGESLASVGEPTARGQPPKV